MKPEKQAVAGIFGNERCFVIPLFQRTYVWNEEVHWAPLWQDIESRARDHLSRDAAGIDDGPRSHFLGAVVLNVEIRKGLGVAQSDVIDGQQRLTTLQLFLAAMRDLAEELEAPERVRHILGRLTTNSGSAKGSRDYFKVWPTNSDQDVFRKVMIAGSEENVRHRFSEKGSLPRLAQAYLFFSESLRACVTEEEGEAARNDRFNALAMAVRESLQLVAIHLEPDDDPQMIFETLNARGQPLLPSDLIRNLVFMQETGEENNRLYTDYWEHFDNDRADEPDEEGEDRFWHIEERQGRLNRQRIDLFIFHYLTMQTGKDIRIGHLFREFRDWRADSKESNAAFLDDLKVMSGHFRRIIEPDETTALGAFAKRLRSLDTSTVHPLLLFLASVEGNPGCNEEINRAIGYLESFVIRRFMCSLTNKNYNRFFLAVLKRAKDAHEIGESSIADAILAEFLRSQEDNARWPDDEDFKEGWCKYKLYVRARPDRAVMILSALELSMKEGKNENVSLPDSLTVEHLLPQHGSPDDYPYASDEEYEREDDESEEQGRKKMMHVVGNLALLTGSLNSAISNGPWSRKVPAIVESSDLRLNAWLRQDAPSAWHEGTIGDRSERLFQHALAIWPKSSL